jgi:hypothetical protein
MKAKVICAQGGQGVRNHTVECVCGHRNRFFVWSWAGHGRARCRGCGKWIRYRTLEIFEP